MKLIDLTQPLFDGMPVYPGDPKVSITQAFTLVKDGWNMNTISLPAHIATHINVPFHAIDGGKTLDDYPVDAFIGTSVVFQTIDNITPGIGLLFKNASIQNEIIQKIIEVKPKFIGIQGYFESKSELETEKLLLREGIISFEGLINIETLPINKEFMFYGFPLKITSGDGSPVRAIAMIP